MRAGLGVLEAAGAHVPLYAGAERPLVEPPGPWRERQDRYRDHPEVRGLWRSVDVPGIARRPETESAAAALVRHAAARPGDVTVVALGPLTNVARAVLLDPEFAGNVARIVVVGGNLGQPDILQEFNIGFDPEAAHTVLTSGASITLVPIDVTRHTRFTMDDVERLARTGGELSRYIASTVLPVGDRGGGDQGTGGLCPA